MTLISVGSTGSSGGTQKSQGSAASDGAAPSGFGELLAGAHPHDPRAESAHDADHERFQRQQDDCRDCDGCPSRRPAGHDRREREHGYCAEEDRVQCPVGHVRPLFNTKPVALTRFIVR